MVEYKIKVTTGDMVVSGTYDNIYVTLIGSHGESERTELDNFGIDFIPGKEGCYVLRANKPLGRLLLVRVEKEPYSMLPENEWFCSKIVVITPDEGAVLFPCYRWISRGDHVELRGGKAMKDFEDDHHLLTGHRKRELEHHRHLYQWKMYAEGLPYTCSFNAINELPPEVRFSMSKNLEMLFLLKLAKTELKLNGLDTSTESWESSEAIKNALSFYKTPISEHVSSHWMDDDFFGYQFLNGANPSVIKQCLHLPSNFPVTQEMVGPFLPQGSTLEKEMKKGNIFLCDYKILDGLPTQVVNGSPLPLTAALCLLYMNQRNELKPIAIQLGQQPSEDNPIFLPSDSKHDWLLAKIFVRNADGQLHQVVFHLLRTHLLAEVFAMATHRNFPVIHPLYKMLVPHFRHTMQINITARMKLLGPDGVLTGSASTTGEEGFAELARRGLSEITYSSLCLPENITARGLETVPNFYFRDDALKLWNIISSFVRAMMKHFYPTDTDVSKDTELQNWISDIFTYGFLGNRDSGIPSSFHTVEELTKFITVVIATTSLQHAAVNNGQFDYNSWVPNGPLMLRRSPPTTKGQSSMKDIWETLPDISQSVKIVAVIWLLSKKYHDSVPLGAFPYERFDEPAPVKIMEDFQAALGCLSEAIEKRNSNLPLPYTYLNPVGIENSIAI